MNKIKQIPNVITVIRLICSLLLLLTKPLSGAFFAIYILCGLSDVLDGYVARKMNTFSQVGAMLDSISDTVFFGIVLFMVIPELRWSWWMLLWVGSIALIRFISLGVGFRKYHTFAFLHTYTNKVTGFVLFCTPILYSMFGIVVTVSLACFIASESALEELAINLRSEKLNRDVRSIFDKSQYSTILDKDLNR